MIDVSGLRGLVVLAVRLEPGRKLVLDDPPQAVDRVFDIGWGILPKLEIERL